MSTYSDIGIDDVPLSSSSRTGATCGSKCKASRSTRAKEEEEQKLDESTEKAVQELLAEWGVEELKAQPAVSSSSFKLLLARPKTKPALVPKPPAVAPPEHLLSGFGDLQTSDFPIFELLIKLATFWLGATRGLLEAFFRELGQAASQSVSC